MEAHSSIRIAVVLVLALFGTPAVPVIAEDPDCLPPSAPENAYAVATMFGNYINWEPPSLNGSAPIVRYVLERAVLFQNPTPEFQFLADVLYDTTEYFDQTAMPWINYAYRIVAENACEAKGPGTIVFAGPLFCWNVVVYYDTDKVPPTASAAYDVWCLQ